MKPVIAFLAARVVPSLRSFFVRLLQPATLTPEEVERLAGKGCDSNYFAHLREQ